MTTVVDVAHLTKTYRDTSALRGVSLHLQENVIYGLLGRNGAGKTTLMSILSAHDLPSAGTVKTFGQVPHENSAIVRRMCFVRDNQRYPDGWTAQHALDAAALAFDHWDAGFCQQLITDFDLPLRRDVRKLSRGQRSALGVIIGLSARAEITFFDEPYTGLDAVARRIFYDRLLEDYALHPRTIVLSSHLIDEVAHLLEHVIVLDRGRIIINESSDALRDRASVVTGDRDVVDAFSAGREVLRREELGRVSSATVLGALTQQDRDRATELHLDVTPVPLQELIVRLTEDSPRHKEAVA